MQLTAAVEAAVGLITAAGSLIGGEVCSPSARSGKSVAWIGPQMVSMVVDAEKSSGNWGPAADLLDHLRRRDRPRVPGGYALVRREPEAY